MADSDLEEEIEGNHSKIPDEVSNYINELCLEYKSAHKKISELKKENAKLRQLDISKNEKIEFYKRKSRKIEIY